MNEPLRIELLGGLRVGQGERQITRFRTQKAAALLAYLAYHKRQTHPRETLLELLWPDLEIEAGRNNLSTILSSLRHQLEPPGVPSGAVLVADRFAIGLNPASTTTDVSDFEYHLRAAEQAGSEGERIQRLTEGVAVYSGPLLPGYYEDWIVGEASRLAEAYVQAVRQLIRCLAKRKEIARALDYARQAIAIDPLREEIYRDVIRMYIATGQRSAALQQYHELAKRLLASLGAAPSIATQNLIRQIAQEEESAAHLQPGPKTSSLSSSADTEPHPTPAAASLHKPFPSENAALTPPTGTVTFLLTERDGSSLLPERSDAVSQDILTRSDALLRCTFQRFGGSVFQKTDDGFVVAFQNAGDALAAALAAQLEINHGEHRGYGEKPENQPKDNQSLSERNQALPSSPVVNIRMRMVLHTGDVQRQEGDAYACVVERAARMLRAAHEGQMLCSEATAGLLRHDLEAGIRLQYLGAYRLQEEAPSEHIFQVLSSDRPQEPFPPLRAKPGYAGSLPLQFTRFFGRESEVLHLQEMLFLPDTHLVTLTGPGGTGKTRLALEVGRRLADAFSGAVWFAPLAEVGDASQIADSLLEVLDLARCGAADPLEQVIEALSPQPTLLILDNFEQLVEEGAQIVSTLLQRVPTLTCLVTSRRRLELASEHEFWVPPLPVPQSAGTPEQLYLYECIRLFVDRAQIVKPDFQLTKNNVEAVAELCARLEGIPLALELAAARAQVLTPAQMLAQLEHRFDFLVSRRRDIQERHRTLRAAIEWSYRLLSPELQRFFGRLAVFRGGWILEAAEVVCAEPLALDYLAQLRECSLIIVEDRGESIRFRMLETLREYCLECLQEDRTLTQKAHVDYFAVLVEQAFPELRGTNQAAWLDRLEQDHDNLRAALQWCHQNANSPELGLWLVGFLWRFWFMRGYYGEGRRWLAAALDQAENQKPTSARGRALSGLGVIATYQGDYAYARPLLLESLAIRREQGDKTDIADSLNHLGIVAFAQGDYASARKFHEESLAIKREWGDKPGISSSLSNLALVAHTENDPVRAKALYQQSLEIDRELNDQWGLAYTLNSLGEMALAGRDFAEARSLFEESLTIRRILGDKPGIATSLGTLGGAYYHLGEYERALSCLEESLVLARELGDKRNMIYALTNLGLVTTATGHYDQARAYLRESLELAQDIHCEQVTGSIFEGFAELAAAEGNAPRAVQLWAITTRVGEQSGSSPAAIVQAEREDKTEALRALLGEQAYEAAWRAGCALFDSLWSAMFGRSYPLAGDKALDLLYTP